MPTRKELFKYIRQLLIDNITSVSGRVYPSYPVKNIQKPFIVLGTGRKGFPDTSINNQPLSHSLTFFIHIYTTTMEENDTLLEEVENLLNSDNLMDCIKTIESNPSIDNIDDRNVEHEGEIILTLEW